MGGAQEKKFESPELEAFYWKTRCEANWKIIEILTEKIKEITGPFAPETIRKAEAILIGAGVPGYTHEKAA